MRFAVSCLAVLLLTLHVTPSFANPVEHARLALLAASYDVNADSTYTATITRDWTLLTRRGVEQHGRETMSFRPGTQRLDLLEAWVELADGTRLAVGRDGIFTRPSEAAQDAPGFTGSETTTVVFPRLVEGARTHVRWRLSQLTPPRLGFESWIEAPFGVATDRIAIDLHAPASMTLNIAGLHGFVVQDHTTDGVRDIAATAGPLPAEEAERGMVSPADFEPLFLATTLPDLETVGAIYHRGERGRVEPDAAITKLAASIVGDRQGLDAARAIYDWVAGHIRYVAVYLDPEDGWVPHKAADVLAHGYGDCKDHVALMQALLAARSIRSEAALINDGARTITLPVAMPGQFDHAMIYLPDYGVFANPTNPYEGFAALDQRLSGKLVVIATDTGLVAQTPEGRPDERSYELDSALDLGADGTISGYARMSLSPALDTGMRAAIADASSMDLLAERLLAATPEGGAGTIETSDPLDLDTRLTLRAIWRSPHGALPRDGGLDFTIPLGPDADPVSRLRQLLSPGHPPTHAMLVGAVSLTWRYTIGLPAGMPASRLPAAVSLANAMGAFSSSYRLDGDVLRVVRHLTIAHDVVPAAGYPALEALVYAALDDGRATVWLREGEARTAENR